MAGGVDVAKTVMADGFASPAEVLNRTNCVLELGRRLVADRLSSAEDMSGSRRPRLHDHPGPHAPTPLLLAESGHESLVLDEWLFLLLTHF